MFILVLSIFFHLPFYPPQSFLAKLYQQDRKPEKSNDNHQKQDAATGNAITDGTVQPEAARPTNHFFIHKIQFKLLSKKMLIIYILLFFNCSLYAHVPF